MQLFTRRANAYTRWFLAGGAGAVLLLVLAITYLPYSTYVTRIGFSAEQPVPFSHQHHVSGLGLDCRYCHTSVERSATAGIPPLHICMSCHSQLWTQADVLDSIRQASMAGADLAWTRLHDLADYAYFDHSAHVNNGVGCAECHGRIDQMPAVHKTASLYMEWCLACHRDPAPHLRPREQIFSMEWQPPADRTRLAGRLMREYHIDTRGLTDCSVCHR